VAKRKYAQREEGTGQSESRLSGSKVRGKEKVGSAVIRYWAR
jgi:hypothetical protein